MANITNVNLLDNAIFKNHCILKISRLRDFIQVRLEEKSGKLIAFGEGFNVSTALQKATTSYLKLIDKYEAEKLRFQYTLKGNLSNTYRYLTDFVKKGCELTIQRMSMLPILSVTVSDWSSDESFQIKAPDLRYALSIADSKIIFQF